MTDWQAILDKYIDIVLRNEGVHFLYPDSWSEEEWAALRSLPATNPPSTVEPLTEKGTSR